jgi:hypothetical protein
MVGRLAIHLLYSYEPLKPDKIKLENQLETVPGKWMRPVSATLLDCTSIHGLAFKIELKRGKNETLCLIPYEFAKGLLPVAQDDKKVLDYIIFLANYII